MTLVAEAHPLQHEEGLPLMGALAVSSPSKASKDNPKRPLLQRIRRQLKHVTPELVAIALGKRLDHGPANSRSMQKLTAD